MSGSRSSLHAFCMPGGRAGFRFRLELFWRGAGRKETSSSREHKRRDRSFFEEGFSCDFLLGVESRERTVDCSMMVASFDDLEYGYS